MLATRDYAELLLEHHDAARMLPPITASDPSFDVARGYEVLAAIIERRKAQGWQPVGRKIGFTNHTIWQRYGVDRPLWAHVWTKTVHYARAGSAVLPLSGLTQPRIEPEVVFKLRAPLPASDDPLALLASIEWIAPGFEIVQCHFPGWKFAAADCTADSGLHGALVIGTPLAVNADNRVALAALLPTFELTLARDGKGVDRGVGSNVLGSPVNALAHLARLLATQPWASPLASGEVITTGTVTDAWPVKAGETWQSHYGSLPIEGLRLCFE